MKVITTFFICITLVFFLLLPCTIFAEKGSANKDSGTAAEIKLMMERIKGNDETQTLKITSLQEKLSLRFDELEKRINLRFDELERRMNLYIKLLAILFALLTFLGYKTITRWIKQTISDKTEEEIKERLTKESIEQLLRKGSEEATTKLLGELNEKGITAVQEMLSELKIKGTETLSEIINIRESANDLLEKLKSQNIDLNKPLSEKTTKDLNIYIKSVADSKPENEYTTVEWFYKGITDYKDNNFQGAVHSWSKALEGGEDAASYSNRGLAYMKLEKYDQAISDCNKAIELTPMSAMAYANRGNVYMAQHEYKKAIADYNKAIDLNPKFARGYSNRGVIYYEMKQYDQAIADYNKAIELSPKDLLTYSNLAEVLIVSGRYKESIELIEKADSLALEGEDYALCLCFLCIARRLLDIDTKSCEARLNNVMQGKLSVTWSFKILEAWLEETVLSPDKKEFIADKIRLIKSKLL